MIDHAEEIVCGEAERVGRYGQVYKVQLVRPRSEVEPIEHVKRWKRYCDLVQESERRILRAANSKKIKKINALLPEWNAAARELKKIGYTQKRIADVLGVSTYAVGKAFSRSDEIRKLKKELKR